MLRDVPNLTHFDSFSSIFRYTQKGEKSPNFFEEEKRVKTTKCITTNKKEKKQRIFRNT